jgi:YD repeat-containing protein
MSDGSLNLQVYSTPLFWHNTKAWVPIDNTVRPLSGRPGWLGTTGNSWTTSIGPAADGIRLSSQAGNITLAPTAILPGAGRVMPKVVREPKIAKPKDAAAAASASPVPEPSVAALNGLWRHAGLEVTVSGRGVADDIILGGPDAPASYGFKVGGAQLSPDGHGGFRLHGAIGGEFSISPPAVLLSSGGDATAASHVTYSFAAGVLTVTVEPQWLRSLPAKAFPVRIDPDENYAPANLESCNSSSCTSQPAGSPTGTVELGVDGSNTLWGAAVTFGQQELDQLLGQGWTVYYAGFALHANVGGIDYDNTCQAVTPCPTTQINLYEQGASEPSSLGQIGHGNGTCSSAQPTAVMFDPPTPGPDVSADVTSAMQCIFNNTQANQWWGLTASGVSGGSNPLRYYNAFISVNLHSKPAASRVVNVPDGEVVATSTPTLQASTVYLTQDQISDNEHPEFQYQVTTGPAPNTGLVVSSGWIEDTSTTCLVGQVPCGDVPPNWQVPAGSLHEGVTYHAWVLTDWPDNYDRYLNAGVAAVQPPLNWGVSFTVRLGFGDGGPSPTDQVGSVPGQSSTPAQGAPSPGLPGSKVSVNMVDGNASFTVSTPKLVSVGGGLSLGFTYNSLAVGAGDTLSGLQGSFYNTVGGSSVLVGQRVDSTIQFNLPAGQGMVAAQNPYSNSATWTGVLNLPLGGFPGGNINSGDQVAIGEISSDGMTVSLGGSTYINDPGPHPAQQAPIFGAGFADTGQSSAITVTLQHSTSNPIVAELFLEDVTQTQPQSTPAIFSVSPGWLTHSPGTLSPGWSFNSNATQATWVGLADHGTSVTIYSSDGTGFEFTNAGGGNYTPPIQAPNARLHIDAKGNFVLDDADGGLIYTFNPNGALSGVVSATDDLHPAALTYTYDTKYLNTNTPTPLPLLRSVSDPVDPTDHTTTLIYSGDLTSTLTSACPSQQNFYQPPSGELCQVKLWDGTTTNLYDNSSSELALMQNPGGISYLFAYDSNGRLEFEMDPLAYSEVYGSQDLRPTDCPAVYPLYCLTQISYDSSGRVSTIITPAPAAGGTVANGGEAERGYCYGNLNAALVNNSGTITLNCTNPAPNVTSVAVAGLAPTAGYVQQVGFDARERITQSRDSTGLATNYVWDSQDRLISTTNPSGIESSSAYDTQGHVINSYGPAPSTSFQANGTPASGQTVATSGTVYDGGMSGLAGAWYNNTTLTGSPVYHSLAPPSESWPMTNTSCSPNPTVIPCTSSSFTTPFSGHLTGLVTAPSNNRLSFDGDGGQIQVDGHPYVNQMGGPYPAQVRQDSPSNWWRLGEASGTTVAADSAGSDQGTYASGLMPGQTDPRLADNDSTAATFNGSSYNVSAPDTPTMEISNTEAFSVEAWVKIPSTGFIQPIVSKLSNTSALTGWEFGIYEGLPYLLLINSWSSNAIDVATAQTLTVNTWHLLTVTYDGSSKAAGVTFYVDGAVAAKATPFVDGWE